MLCPQRAGRGYRVSGRRENSPRNPRVTSRHAAYADSLSPRKCAPIFAAILPLTSSVSSLAFPLIRRYRRYLCSACGGQLPHIARTRARPQVAMISASSHVPGLRRDDWGIWRSIRSCADRERGSGLIGGIGMVFAAQETSFSTPNTWNDAWNKCGNTSPRFRPCGLDIAPYFPSPLLFHRICFSPLRHSLPLIPHR